jgi:hypothetical protein
MPRGNAHSGSSFQGRITDAEAFELCHPDVRHALRTCAFDWSAGWALSYQRKHGSAATVKRLREADMNTIRKGWSKGVKSPCISYRLKPLYPECAP